MDGVNIVGDDIKNTFYNGKHKPNVKLKKPPPAKQSGHKMVTQKGISSNTSKLTP